MASFVFGFVCSIITVKLKKDDYTTCTSKGDTVAIVATARKISKIIYNLLSICLAGTRSGDWKHHWFETKINWREPMRNVLPIFKSKWTTQILKAILCAVAATER